MQNAADVILGLQFVLFIRENKLSLFVQKMSAVD